MKISTVQTHTSDPVWVRNVDDGMRKMLEFCYSLPDSITNYTIKWQYATDLNWVTFIATRKDS